MARCTRTLVAFFCVLCIAASPARAQKPPAPVAATTASPAPTPAEALEKLYQRLAATMDQVEAAGILAAIDRAHLNSGSPTSDLLMDRALTAMRGTNPKLALELLDQIVVIEPDWAEGWNKRATVRFTEHDDIGSLNDISRVLAIDARHVGALYGMAAIMQRNGFAKGALAMFKRVREIYPAQEEFAKMIETLTGEVEGRGI